MPDRPSRACGGRGHTPSGSAPPGRRRASRTREPAPATARRRCARAAPGMRSRCRPCRTETRALAQRAGPPGQLAAGTRRFLVHEARERPDDPRGAVAPLHPDLTVAVSVECHPVVRPPVDEPVLLDREAVERLRDPFPSPSASTQPANPCAGPRQRPLQPCRCWSTGRPHPAAPAAIRRSGSRRARALGPSGSCRDCPTSAPALVPLVRGDQLGQPLQVGGRGREPLEHEPDSRLPHPEAALGVLVRKVRVGLERALQIGDETRAESTNPRCSRRCCAATTPAPPRYTVRNRAAGSSPG